MHATTFLTSSKSSEVMSLPGTTQLEVIFMSIKKLVTDTVLLLCRASQQNSIHLEGFFCVEASVRSVLCWTSLVNTYEEWKSANTM